MFFTMPLEPPLEPSTFITPIVLIFHTETLHTPSKVFPGPHHHVHAVLGLFIVKEGVGREGWGLRLSCCALFDMFTSFAIM
jgi:hypothetical protein